MCDKSWQLCGIIHIVSGTDSDDTMLEKSQFIPDKKERKVFSSITWLTIIIHFMNKKYTGLWMEENGFCQKNGHIYNLALYLKWSEYDM